RADPSRGRCVLPAAVRLQSGTGGGDEDQQGSVPNPRAARRRCEGFEGLYRETSAGRDGAVGVCALIQRGFDAAERTMRRRYEIPFRGLAYGAFVAMSLATSAYGDDPPNQTSAAAQSAYSNKLICKREQVTGSMIPKRVCKTQEQIDKEHEAIKEYA